MRAHARSDTHIRHAEAELLAARVKDLLFYRNYRVLGKRRR